ncbi:MAG: Holliday junction branch migration protein RuvA [Ruminococcus sp.]|nr:Holliday junction branch migration protein RuvA [Ruminococcus sp.]MCM1381862.1 Holliday junction branch migration protein RuvA [Muribaculaceae bacterium]MCM1479953.1 Holliday junction branch migration protein RuvA [Muribaculaceae bacterium]
MIYSVNGKIIHKTTDAAVIDCGGVGYLCRTTLATLSQIGRTGESATLYTYLHVREDNIELFGFATEQELNCFKMLISVSGVGPKAGLAILSDTNPEKFALTVATGDYKAFTKTKGVGPKLAQRVVLELKDKITKEQLSGGVAAEEIFEAVSEGSSTAEAISALVVLGYSQTEAASAVAKLDSSLAVEELIRQALKKMAANL